MAAPAIAPAIILASSSHGDVLATSFTRYEYDVRVVPEEAAKRVVSLVHASLEGR